MRDKDNSRILRAKVSSTEDLLKAINLKLKNLNEVSIQQIVNILEGKTLTEGYNLLGPGSAGTVGAGFKSYSVTNIGDTDALLDGKIFPAGFEAEFGGDKEDVLSGLSYDTQLTTLIITTVQ